jgi:hypothetical protein
VVSVSVVDVVDVPAVCNISIIIYLVVVSGTNPGLVIVSVLASLDVITTSLPTPVPASILI